MYKNEVKGWNSCLVSTSLCHCETLHDSPPQSTFICEILNDKIHISGGVVKI